MKKHFVTFFYPGVIVADQTERPIDSWDVDKAVAMARALFEQFGCCAYAFQFITRERNDDELDSHEAERSGVFYLGGLVETLEEVGERDRHILYSNMKINGWSRVITNVNGRRWTQPLYADDIVLDFTP